MATNTLIQKLYGADESGVGETGFTQSNRRQIETFIASATITAGQVVGADLTKTAGARLQFVKPVAIVANGNGLAIGVALKGAAAGERVDVVVAGYCEKVNCHGAVVSGNMLTAGLGSIGMVDGRTNTDIAPAFGIALEASAASSGGFTNPAAAYIYKQY